MENGGASTKGVLIPVSESSEEFQSCILSVLQSAYLYEESKQFFRYKSAVLVKNPELEEKYNAFRVKRKSTGYSDDDLKESYGFLLFDDSSKANALGETGVFTGNSTCSTLGDPSKGVYISMYSDCLDQNRWYHGKSGYIAIVRLTKGKVKRVIENYTQNFTEPSVGFDCHVSEQLPSVSDKTSSFLAFERTQYYIYELLDDGSNGTTLSPSAACPFAVVSFSYMDTKATLVSEEKSERKILVYQYFPWTGQFQIDNQFYNVGLRSTSVALIPAKLPPVIKVESGISMSALRQVLPRAVFETCYAEEVYQDSFYCSLSEFVPAEETEESSSFAQLLLELKENDLALTVPLNDCGFLILLHSSHFLRYDDTESTSAEALQGLFVFPDSRVVRRDTKFGLKKFAMPLEILPLLPVLSYAEGEVEKTPMDPSNDLCEVLAQHIQSYAMLIDPGLSSPSRPPRELSIFPDQYDVPIDHKHLYSSPEWTNRTWQSFKSYLSKPASFQLPVSKVSEILVAGQEEQREDLDDDVYICVSSPEVLPASPVGMDMEDPLSDNRSPLNDELSMDTSNAELQVSPVPQSTVTDNLQAGDDTKDQNCNNLTELNKTNDTKAKRLLTHSSEDLPAELIVSITSAEHKVTDETLSSVDLSTTKHDDFQFSGFSQFTKLQTADINSVGDQTDKTKRFLHPSIITKLRRRKRGKLTRKRAQALKGVSKPAVETPSLQTVKSAVEANNSNCNTNEYPKELDIPQLNNSLKTRWKKLRRKRRFGKSSSKNKVRAGTVGSAKVEKNSSDDGQQSLESIILMELETFHLRKKTERWDLKPVISECRRILVPFGSVDVSDHFRSLKVKLQSTKNDECLEKTSTGVRVTRPDTVEIEKAISIASQTDVTEIVAADSTCSADNNQSVTHVTSEQSIVEQQVPSTPDLNISSSINNDTDHLLVHVVQSNQTETLSPVKPLSKGEYLLSRLKSVLSMRKRKLDLLGNKEKVENTCHGDEPHFKKINLYSDTETLKCNNATTPNANSDANQVLEMPSVDLAFARYLGLTPKVSRDKIQKTEGQDARQRKDLMENEKPVSLDKQPKVMQRPLSIFPKKKRIKTLKMHQGISAENVKKKWWLHFQTPACYASEKVTDNDCSSDNTVRKTVMEKMKSACSSTDALNLLADLALSVSYDQAPLQPNEALDKNPNESLKKCDLKTGLSSAEQESVLHALLKTPAAIVIQPVKSPTQSLSLGDSELIDLMSKEHNYSLPPSSCLLLDLPGTTFQVLPVSGSTRLLNHHQTVYGNEAKTLHPSVIQDDTNEYSRTSKCSQRHKNKFKLSRTSVIMDGSIKVTRKWQEYYNFSLDSRFTSDPMSRVVIRALHGPWDYSIPNATEEMQLIYHMWIGLFYSRSTARSFQIDPSFVHQCLEEKEPVKKASEMVSGPSSPEHDTNSSATLSSVTNTPDSLVLEALDLSTKESTLLEPESEVLDLSQRNSVVEPVSLEQQFNRKEFSGRIEPPETLNGPKLPVKVQEEETFQSCKKMEMETVSEVIDVGNINENKESETAPEALGPDYTEVLPLQVERMNFSRQEEIKGVSFEPETVQATFGIGHELHGCNKDTICTKDHTENSEAAEKSLEQNHETDSMEIDMDKKLNSSLEEKELVHIDKDEKQEESCKRRMDPCPESNIDPFYDATPTDDDSANKESETVCMEDKVVNINVCSSLESKDVSPDQNDSLNRNVDFNGLGGFKDDDYLRKDGLDEKKSYISTTAMDQDLRDEPSPKTCDGVIKEVCISECDHQAEKHKKLLLADSTEDTSCAYPIQLKNSILNSFYTPTNFTSISKEDSLAEENFESNKENCFKPSLPCSDESTSSLDESVIPKVKDSIETKDKTKEANFHFHLCHNHKEQEIKPTEKEDNMGKTTSQEQFQLQSPSKYKVVNMCEPDEAITEKMASEVNETNGKLDKSWDGITIPFLETYTHKIHVVQPQDESEKAVQDQEVIPFINETFGPVDELPIEKCSPAQMCDENAKVSSHEIPLVDASKTNKLDVLVRVFDRRSPTPTMDEKPYEYVSSSSPNSSAFAYSGSEICQNITEKCSSRSSTPVMETSTANTEPNHHHGLGPDVELRTLRVLQGIDTFISTAYHFGMPTQTEKVNKKLSLDPPNISSKKSTLTSLGPSPISVDVTAKRTSCEKPPEVSSTSSQDLHPKSTHDVPASPFKNKLKEVKSKPKNKNFSVRSHKFNSSNRRKLSVESDTQSSGFCDSAVGLRYKPTSQSDFKDEYSHSQCPVITVKPSKSEKIQAHWHSEDADVETTSQNKQPITQIVQNTQTNLMLPKNTTKGNFGLNNHNTPELSSKTPCLANTSYKLYKADEDKSLLDPPHQYKDKNTLKFTISSLPSMQSFDCIEGYTEYDDQCQGFFENSSDEAIGHRTDQTNCKDYSEVSIYDKDNDLSKEHIPKLACTVFNTGQNNSYCVLDQLSQRCLSDDLTKASVERESLIFSEKMKNLLKKSKGGPFSQQDTCDSSTQSCTSPLTVNFSRLEEQDGTLEFLDMPLVRQKISVDMSDRKGLTDSKEERVFGSHSQRTSSPVEHSGISGMIADYAKVYQAKMQDVCSRKKTSSRAKRFQHGYSGAEHSNHFNFCDQMKKQLDESFRSNLNAVVKKSCKTKYRFYILVTSDDPFFDQTKIHMEAEGHTAVRPSEFFPGEGSSSCLLIILRNEDIAKHICKIPHLVELKMTPDVQFAGVDEPDDVVNLTHQELFNRAGFIMLDRAVLETLSLCDMKKISETLQELSRKGKWKWMLHYRDSRRLKENARLSEEANEKKLFLYCGQDTGVLEVLPYHDCDSMSKDQPDYLTCLLRLQVQQISSRFPVFITDATTDSAFGQNGILTMTLNTFLTKSPTEIFTV